MHRTRRVGPRMADLCRILAGMGGSAPSKSAVYMQLSYRGRSSNHYGSLAMARAIRAGLIRETSRGPGTAVAVELTDTGWDVSL